MKIHHLLLAGIVLLTAMSCNTIKSSGDSGKGAAEAAAQLKNFPAPRKGYVRYVINLPSRSINQEQNYKIELSPGKLMMVDCNRHFLAGSLKEETVNGFGYTYYTFATSGNVSATRMGCPDAKLTQKFVAAKSLLTDYNSRLPLVIYAPEGYQVRYKVFKASAENAAPEA